MKYKIGDRVKVKSLTKYCSDIDGCSLVKGSKNCIGETGKVTKENDQGRYGEVTVLLDKTELSCYFGIEDIEIFNNRELL
jgi:D-arabinose 1-dehydrogenase-like Zn-dependent alcohol dehydrogenase